MMRQTMFVVGILIFTIEACRFVPAPIPASIATVQLTQTNFPTDTSTPTELPTNTLTPTELPTNTSTPTKLPTDTPTETKLPTDTPTVSPTFTQTTLTPTSTRTGTPTSSCPSPTPHAEISVSAENLKVGDTLIVTTILSNEGCGTLGLPQYRLYIQSDNLQSIFDPSNPAPVVHSLGVTSGRPDTVEFELTAVTSGQATLNVGVSFEFHVGYPGPAYWLSTGTKKMIVTVAP